MSSTSASASTATASPVKPQHTRASRLRYLLWGSWPRRIIVVAVVVGFGLRCGWVVYAARTPQGLHDPFFYLDYSRRAVQGGGFYRLKDGEPTAYYPIGYPVVLTIWFWFMQHSPFPDHWIAASAGLNLIFGTASIALAGVLGRRLVGPWVGAISAVIVALFPSLIFHTATILTETTFNFVFLCALLVLCWRPWVGRVPSWRRIVVFGLLLGASIQVRPIALLVLPMVLIALWRTAEWRLAVGRFAVVVGIVAAMMVPWTVRNELVMHAFLPIGTTTGDNLCIGNFPGAQGHFAFPKWCFGHDLKVKRPRFETERNTRLTHQALEWAVHHPGRELQLVWDRTRSEFLSDHDGLSAVQSYGDDPFIPPDTAATMSDVADWYFFAVLALAVLGLPLFLHGGDRRRLFVFLSIIAVVIAVWPFFGDPRFHVPINVLIPIPAAMVLLAAARRVRPGATDAPRSVPSLTA